MAQSQFSLKKKIGRPEHLLTPQLLGPITSHFCLNPHPVQRGHHMCITRYLEKLTQCTCWYILGREKD